MKAGLDSKKNSPRALLQAYVNLLRMRAKDPKSIKIIACRGEKSPFISVSRYASKNSAKLIGEGNVNIDGDISGQPLRIIGMLNMAFAASSIPNDTDYEERHEYSNLILFIQSQYKEITGQALISDNILEAIRHIVLPIADAVPVESLREYYRLTIEQLYQSA